MESNQQKKQPKPTKTQKIREISVEKYLFAQLLVGDRNYVAGLIF